MTIIWFNSPLLLLFLKLCIRSINPIKALRPSSFISSILLLLLLLLLLFKFVLLDFGLNLYSANISSNFDKLELIVLYINNNIFLKKLLFDFNKLYKRYPNFVIVFSLLFFFIITPLSNNFVKSSIIFL